MRIERLDNLLAELRRLATRSQIQDNGSVLVGFTAKYALRVHENIQMKWRGKPRKSGIGVYWGPAGQAKFLEQPARTLVNDGTLGRMMTQTYLAFKSLRHGLLLCGLRLQREAQNLVPVEFGNLRASAFTRQEK